MKTETSGPTVGKISESVSLICHISGVAITDSSYAWDWIRQTPGKELQHLVMQYPFTGLQHTASSFRTRVNSSTDPSRNQVCLQLLSPAAADTATYFCSMRELEKGTVFEMQAGPGQNSKEGLSSTQVFCGCFKARLFPGFSRLVWAVFCRNRCRGATAITTAVSHKQTPNR